MATKPVKKPMTKAQLVAHLAEKSSLAKTVVSELLEELAQTAYREAKKAGFTIPGVGKLQVVHRKARKGRNPQTGEEIKIPARKALKFRIAKAAKDATL